MLKYLKNSKFGKSALAAITTLSLYSTDAKADDNFSNATYFEQDIEPLDIIVEGAIAYASTVFFHELGHYSAARMLGYDATISGPEAIDNSFAIASTYINWDGGEKLPRGHDIIFSSAGFGFTTFGNVMLTNYLVNTNTDNSFRPFVGALSLMMMLDRYVNIAGSAMVHYIPGLEHSSGEDANNFISSIGINKEAGYGLLTAGTLAEIILRWSEVRYLYQTAIGNNPEYEPSGIIFSFVPGEDSVSFQLSSQF